MRVLVAGGAGFIGSHFCEGLLERGHEVACLDNFVTGSRRNIQHMVGHGLTLIEADVADAPAVEADRIVHLASPASPLDYQRLPLETMRANALGSWRLLEIAAEKGTRVTLASTSEVYGDPLIHPQPETYWGNVDPVGPRSCYDESKRFAEALLMAHRRARGVRANIVRIFNTYGPRMRPDDGRAIPQLMSAAIRNEPLTVHGDGSQTRSFCYVTDMVNGIMDVVLDEHADGEIFNIGNPHEVTIAELAVTIRDLEQTNSDIVFVDRPAGDPERRKPDIQKIRSRYGWTPAVPLREGLALTSQAFRRALAESGHAASPEVGRGRSVQADHTRASVI